MDRANTSLIGRLPQCFLGVLLSWAASPSVAGGATAGPSAAGTGAGPHGYAIRHQVEFTAADVRLAARDGYTWVEIPGAVYLHAPGWPRLPSTTVRIALPIDMRVTGLRVRSVETEVLPGRHRVAPAQRVCAFSDAEDACPRAEPDRGAYASGEAYPPAVAEFERQADLAGQNFAVVRIHPLQYVAAEERLLLHTSVEFVLEGEPGHELGDYLPRSASAGSVLSYSRMVSGMVDNPQAVQLSRGIRGTANGRGVEPGCHEYVVVTKADWADAFAPLVEWKTRKGVPATVVTTEWIYAQESYEGTTVEKIRGFVRDAYESWGTTYFLLGGRVDVVPCEERWIVSVKPDESIPNDTYYADFDDDWVCEVHVGRVMVRNVSDIAIVVNKILNYEKSPSLSNYARKATLFGMDQAPGGAEGENCKTAIHSLYIPADWTVQTIYDSDLGPHRTPFLEALNLGNNLVNHIDHATPTSLGAGSSNHGDYIFAYHVLQLTNLQRPSIMYSVGCHPCRLTVAQPIGETWVRAGNGAGVAFVGNTGPGFSELLADDGHSLRYDRYFFRSLFHEGQVRLGECFSHHKNVAYEDDDYYRFIFAELTLIGDPEMPVWTSDPQAMSVVHPSRITVGVDTAIQVGATVDGEPMPGAVVCVRRPGDIYEVADTNEFGVVVFPFTSDTPGPLQVTVTSRNHLPYLGTMDACLAGDMDCDGVVDSDDVAAFCFCLDGPDAGLRPECVGGDLDGDEDVDLADFAVLQRSLAGS